MTLADTQAAFHALATRAGNASLAAEDFLVGSPGLGAAERIGIYANMYLWRLTDALRDDYPKLAALLGDERFLSLAEAYAREHASDRPDLGQFGRHLSAFLRRLAPPERADLADLAAVDWARSEVFFEAPLASVGRDALAGLGPDAFLGARLQLIPARAQSAAASPPRHWPTRDRPTVALQLSRCTHNGRAARGGSVRLERS